MNVCDSECSGDNRATADDDAEMDSQCTRGQIGRAEPESLLQMTGIHKAFGGQRVLIDVDFDLHAGEVHVLAGENGAGKSTLIRILGGVHQPDAGRIGVGGLDQTFRHPKEAAARGIAIIHQELSLVPSMSVLDNMFLGHERSRAGWLDRSEAATRAGEILRLLGLSVDLRCPVGELPISGQQVVEIAKALALNARIIVMDEPTSALSEPEVRRLFTRIGDLKANGCGIIYITHRLEEIYALADRITVLRDGRKIITSATADLPAAELIRCMIGRTLSDQAPRREHDLGDIRLKVSHCTVRAPQRGRPPLVDDLSFEVRSGEILGIVGLRGAGVSQLLWATFGALGKRAGARIEIDGKLVRIRSPRQAIRQGIALVTNDRRRWGLILGMDIVENVTLAALPRITPGGWLTRRREAHHAHESIRSLQVRASSLWQRAATLSGGNQQKVVLAKWMATQPRILLLDEPTRGVDVGAKHDIFLLMNQWAARGHAIVFSTSELPELLQVSDRIMVMQRGRAVAWFDSAEASREDLLHAAMGEATVG